MYALTGANGQLGRLVLQHLLNKVPANQIIATTRHPEQLADFAAKGVIVRPADFSDPATLAAAFEGATRLLIISTDTLGQRAAQHRAAIEAAVTAGVSHIIYTSAPAADPNSPNPILKEHGQTETALAASGVKWTALRNNIYSNTLPNTLGALLDNGKLLSLAGQGKPIWVSREDCARTAAAILTGDGTITGPVDLTGQEALGFPELAQRLSNILGRPIVSEALTEEEFTVHLVAKGLPQPAVAGLSGIVKWLAGGDFATPTNLVERVTGVKPTPVDEVLRTIKLPQEVA